MKKGDIVAKERLVEDGQVLASSFKEQARAQQWGTTENQYNLAFQVVLAHDGGYNVVARGRQTYQETAKVMWVVNEEASLEVEPGGYKVVNWKEEEWKVIHESAPSFQSNVANMTEEQLRESIDNLRNTRVSLPKARKTASKSKPTVDKNDPIAQALAGMTEEEKLALKKKLGLV